MPRHPFFIFLLGVTCMALDARAAMPTPPAILRAREQIILRDRPGALTTLTAAIEAEKIPTKKAELIKERRRLASLFLSNDGQRAYELGESIRFSGQPGFMPKYDEALKLEGPHWTLLLSRAIGYLQQKNCPKALLELNAADELEPQREEVALLRARATWCEGAASDLQLEKDLAAVKTLTVYKKAFLAQKRLEEKRVEEALRLAREAIQADDHFPMGYFWAWKNLKAEPGYGLDEGQRYLALCKNLDPAMRRKYFLEPELCTGTDQVEEFIKKWESQTQ